MIKKKYRALRFIAFICQVLAWVSLVLSILGAIGAIGAGLIGIISVPALENNFGGANPLGVISAVAGITSGIGILVFGIVNFIVLLAAAEYVHVQIDTEQNTRISAEYLRQLLQAQQSAQSVQSFAPVAASPIAPLLPETYPAEPTITAPSTPLRKE